MLDQINQSIRSVSSVDPDDGQIAFFRAVLGWDKTALIRLAVETFRTYLPTFRIRHPKLNSVARLLHDACWDVKDEERYEVVRANLEKIRASARAGFVDAASDDVRFLQAVASLADALEIDPAHWVTLAAWCTDVVAECVWQRASNVWVADDPAAAYADREHFWLTEQVLMQEDLAGAKTTRAKLETLGAFLQGRRLGDNLAARAIALREWSQIFERLQASERPSVIAASINEDAALEIWLKSGRTWQIVSVWELEMDSATD